MGISRDFQHYVGKIRSHSKRIEGDSIEIHVANRRSFAIEKAPTSKQLLERLRKYRGSEAARDLAKKVGVEIKHLYLTSGESDLVIFVDAPSGDNVAEFALAVSSLGNVRTRTARAWSAEEYRKIVSELP